MKKAFLYAYDRQNLGDDLFVHAITGRYPNTQFYMWSDRKNQETFSCLPNLKVVDKDSGFVHFLYKLRPSLVARYRAWLEKRCDAVVYDNKGKPLMILEFKAPEVAVNQKVFDQISRYNIALHLKYLIVSNGLKHFFCIIDPDKKTFAFQDDIPEYAAL
jgi:hypothetical protein